ncbi:hypothetical protein EV182_003925, partial [Spiromyces aspiralis]
MKYTPGWVLTKIMALGVLCAQKLKRYQQEADILRSLLAQTSFQRHKRGEWYERLLTLLTRYLPEKKANPAISLTARGHIKERVALCKQALNDPHLPPVYYPGISQRLMAAEKALSLLPRERTDVSKYQFREAPTRTIHAKKLTPSEKSALKAGRNLVWWGFSGPSSVENIALEHYCQLGYKGQVDSVICLVVVQQLPSCQPRAHCLVASMYFLDSVRSTQFALAFWDILFCSIPGAFETPFQYMPMDLTTVSFYSRRKHLIDERLDKIRNGEAHHFIEQADERERARNTYCVGLTWNIPKSAFLEIAECIGGNALARIFEYFAKEYGVRNSGAPDLLLWDMGKKSAMFVEVKGPGDRLSETQK